MHDGLTLQPGAKKRIGRAAGWRSVFFALAALLPPLLADAAEAPITRAAIVRDYGRVTFDWGKKVRFSASGQGNRAVIRFDRETAPDTSRILASLSPYVTAAQLSGDGRTLTLSMNGPYRVRSFVSGNMTGIDIVGLGGATPAAMPPPKQEAQPPPKKADVKKAEAKPPKASNQNTPKASAAKPGVRPSNVPADWEAAERAARNLDRTRQSAAKKPEALAEEATENAEIKATAPAAEKAEAAAGKVAALPALAAFPESRGAQKEAAAPAFLNRDAKPPEPAAKAGSPAETETLAATPAEPKPAMPGAGDAAPNKNTPPLSKAPGSAETEKAASGLPADSDNTAAMPKPDPSPAGALGEGNALAAAPRTGTPGEKETAAPGPAATAAPALSSVPAAPDDAVAASVPLSLAPALRIAFPASGAAALFQRGDTAWIVLEGDVPLSAGAISAGAAERAAEVTRAEEEGTTVYRLRLAGPQGISALRTDKGWEATLSPVIVPPSPPLALRIVKDAAGNPALSVPLTDAGGAKVVTLSDPATGEPVQVALLGGRGGFFPPLRMADAEFLPSALGMAMIAKSDGVRMSVTENGFAVTAPGGLRIGDGAFLNRQPPTLLPPPPRPVENFLLSRQVLEEKIREAGGVAMAAPLRKQLAALYLAHGLAPEALGQLDILRSESPGFYSAHRLAAQHGAANFLLHRINEGAEDFRSPELADAPEAAAWRTLLGQLLGTAPAPDADPAETDTPGAPEPREALPADPLPAPRPASFDFVSLYSATFRHYPPAIAQKMGLFSADLAIAADDPDTAEAILTLLRKDGRLEEIAKQAEFIRGAVAAKRGQFGEAEKIWQALSDDASDRFVRARAAYSLVALKLEQGSIERVQAIRQLDALRIVWRGDSLELNLLRLLADLYIAGQDNVNALRTLREIVSNFPAGPEATRATEEMSGIFQTLFNGGGADKLQPIEALSLYYEFRELTPLGAQGDAMIRSLADRLAAVDLLERAGVLLNHQIRYRLEGAERSRVGARLALIQLMNRQPGAAIETLQATNYGNNPDELNRTRSHLAAKALSDLGRPAEAIALLEDDLSPDAQMLRVNIYWAAKDWKNVAASVEEILGNRPDLTAPLTLLESEYLLKLALAYVFEKDPSQLQYLRDYFGPLMKDNPNAEVFLFITDPDSPLDTRNFEAVATDISRIRSFMETYQKRVRRGGLSNAIE